MAEAVCWLNEDCIAGYEHKGECRFPSWTTSEQAADMDALSPLDDFLRAFRADGNDWWRIPQGDQLNLFEDAVDRMEAAEAKVAAGLVLADAMDEIAQRCEERDGTCCSTCIGRRGSAKELRAALTGADQ